MKNRICRTLVAAVALGAVFGAAAAAAETLYKLIHKDGKVTYSESPPKDFDGQVIPMNVDTNANTMQLPRAAPPSGPSSEVRGDGVQRRRTETDPGKMSSADKVQAAKDKLEAARKALQDARDSPGEGDVRWIGNAGGGTRAVPTEGYQKRLERLEANVRQAEEELQVAEKAASLAALALLAALAWADAPAQVLYKWIDENGKVQYSDVPPKKFKGEVTRIDVEVDKSTLPPAARPAQDPEKAPAVDVAAKRRAERARLEAQLDRARERVDAARKALEESQAPESDERQVIQQRAATGGIHGMAPRNNCRVEKDKNGHDILMCPTAVPTPEYFERIARLEENLKKAEEELAAAEQAWRRGVD